MTARQVIVPQEMRIGRGPVPVVGGKTEAPLVEPGRNDDASYRPDPPGRARLLKRGTILQGRYRIVDVIGVGGMSTVYRARDLRFAGVERLCAVKEMFNLGDDDRLRQLRLTNFQREAALLATLTHSAIPRIYDYFEQQETIYLVLELIRGHDLETLLSQRSDPFPQEILTTWFIDLCEVVAHLHQLKPEPIVFRDLKPSNIMLRQDGALMLVDFGIARSLAPAEKGTMIGTEGYAPPEQYRGIADARGDVYAIGASLHHLATGSDPRSETPFTFANRPPRRLNPAISSEFEELILKCVAYAPEERFDSADELRRALIRIRDRPITAIKATPVALRSAAQGSRLLVPPAPGPGSAPTYREDDRLAWVVATEDEVRGTASEAGGAVYVGSYDGHLYAIDETDGTVRWRFRAQRGVVTRPLPAAELVIIGSEDHTVYAVLRQQARAAWTFRTSMPVRSSPTGDQRGCFIGSDDGFLYRLDRASGALIWRYRTWGPVRSSPTVTDRTVIVGSDDGYLYSVERDSGRLAWRSHVGAPIQSSPAVGNDVIVVGAEDGCVRAFALDTSKVLWCQQTGKVVRASPCIVDGSAYVGSADGALYAFDLNGGAVHWKTSLCRQITGSPVIDGGLVYVGGTDGTLYCVSRSDGAVTWQQRLGGPIVAKPLITHDHVIVGSMDGNIYAVRRET